MTNQNVNILRYLLDFTGKSKLYYFIYLSLIPILPIIRNFILPEILGDFYNNFKLKNKKYSNYLLISIICFYFIMFTSTLIVNFMAWRTIPKFYEYVVLRIYEYIYENTFCNYDNLNISEIILKISKMTGIFNSTLRAFKEDFCYIFVSIIFGFFYFYLKLGKKYLYTFIIFFLLISFCQYNNIIYVSRANKLKSKVGDKVYLELSDSLYNISTVQVFQNKVNEIELLNHKLSKYSSAFYNSLIGSLFFDSITKYLNLFMIIILGYILWDDYNKKKINDKILLQCSQVIILLSYICDYIGVAGRQITDNLGEIYDINEFFNTEIPLDTTCKKGKDKFKNGDIVFKNVYHKYKNSDKFSLENISFKIEKGEKIALIGHSGSGKSTIIKLLLKQQPTNYGDITINGQTIKTISPEELARNIFYIPQNPKLFNRTLYDNIVYGLKTKPTPFDIIETLRNINMNELANVFEEKMNILVGREGNSLSGGQRQIVWLLRSLYRMKPIIVLDEPTAALDKENKKIVIETIKKLNVGKTIIIISHDNIDHSFRKIIFKQGKMIEQDFFPF